MTGHARHQVGASADDLSLERHVAQGEDSGHNAEQIAQALFLPQQTR